jgi:hypothetical protein
MICLRLTIPSQDVLFGELAQSEARFTPGSGVLSNLLSQLATLLNCGNPLGELTETVNLLGQLLGVLVELLRL